MTRIGRTSRRVVAISGALLGAVVLLGLVPWRLVAAESEKADQRPSGRLAESEPLAATPPVHLEFKLYAIDILEGGTRLAAVNKLTGERRLLEVPRNTRVTNAIAGDDVAVCTMRGTPISQLILYNRRMGKWSTFPLPMCVRPLLVQNHESDNPLEACACVGDSMVCYQLKDRAVAYSGTNDKWGVLATNAEPAVGDDFIMVNSAIENSVFTATSGVWVTVKAPAVTRR